MLFVLPASLGGKACRNSSVGGGRINLPLYRSGLARNIGILLQSLFRFTLGCIEVRFTSIHQPTKAHIISHKTLLKHFKTLRHVSILSDHHQGALFLAKVILRYSQFNSYFQTRCCGSISCCVGMCCGAVARCASYVVSYYSAYDAHLATNPQHILTQHDLLPQHLV